MKTQGTPLTFTMVMSRLEASGTAQNRKVYLRHGAHEPLFGVSFASLNALKKQIKTNQSLAEALWASGNYDARILATMVADPAKMGDSIMNAWIPDLDNYVLCDAFAKLTAKSPLARQKMVEWMQSTDEWICRAGWIVLTRLAMHDKSLPNNFFESYLSTIERDIHNAKNWVRDAMNKALIAIGIRNDVLRPQALAVSARIGKVEVDHGETNCKTPDAAQYIQKTGENLKRRHEEIKRRAL
ncbi:MAG: DNA alkylation repair protein [Anaerolineales bacterium]|nr:DNA alkylation repair protein [Anaerolineales bacterium]